MMIDGVSTIELLAIESKWQVLISQVAPRRIVSYSQTRMHYAWTVRDFCNHSHQFSWANIDKMRSVTAKFSWLFLLLLLLLLPVHTSFKSHVLRTQIF
jgi:hypothetical protein